MNPRTLRQLITATTVAVVPGFFMRRALPVSGLRQLSPFLLLDHIGPDSDLSTRQLKVPPHPHRGFMPVTLLFEGALTHRDSTGNELTLTAGEVGWMIAGAGIVYAEKMGSTSDTEKKVLHAVQLWINLPAKDKLIDPSYRRLKVADIPVLKQEENLLRIIAGTYKNLKGPAPVFTALLLAHGIAQKGAKINIDLPEDFDAAVYALEGSLLNARNERLEEGELSIWNRDGVYLSLTANEQSQYLLLAGKALQEPLATYGTFVMNYPQELLQAIDDYKAGKMGYLSDK